MRALWIDAGNDADYTRLKAEGIESPVYAITDPRLSLAYLNDVKTRGFVPGVYAVKSWWPQASATEFADIVSAQLEKIAPGTPSGFPFVCIDYEPTDVPGILAFSAQWRRD